MNFSVADSVLSRQRCRPWTPLLTQQLRLRHLYQIMAYNVRSDGKQCLYYTLHLTPMCAPFYTSEKVEGFSPKWAELDSDALPYLSVSGFVLRIWQTRKDESDMIVSTWGIHLSGLIYLGVKLSEIQPESFLENSVILHLRGGYFSSYNVLRTDLQKPLPFIDNLNVISTDSEMYVYRNVVSKNVKHEIKHSYGIDKLQKLHSIQLMLRNRNLDVQLLTDKIINRCGLCNTEQGNDMEVQLQDQSPVHRHPSQLLTMTTLNKMLQSQGKPTKLQKQRTANLNKRIETIKFKTKVLSQERDKKLAHLRQLKQNRFSLSDENAERGSILMENYHKLSRESEKVKEWRKGYIQLKGTLNNANVQLFHRRQQLINQLSSIYPIQEVQPQKFIINEVYLPHSDNLTDCSDAGLAVALGHVSHVLLMVASFLQVPLRYPVMYFGSRSRISDHITAGLMEKDREFPLYAKGKDRMQFNYAVYLLNKNISQLRWICGQQTPNLRTTLPNLLSFLLATDICSNSRRKRTDERAERELDVLDEKSPFRRDRKRSEASSNESKQGLGEILAIPEAYMNKQISSDVFKSYATGERFRPTSASIGSKSKPVRGSFDPDTIEQGTDILHSSLNQAPDYKTDDVLSDSILIVKERSKNGSERLLKQNRRISRSVGSINEESNFEQSTCLEPQSDVLLSATTDPKPSLSFASLNCSNNTEEGRQEFLQKWLDSGPALMCSEENLYPDEILGTAAASSSGNNSTTLIGSPLTLRTDALLNTTSFNLVKPK